MIYEYVPQKDLRRIAGVLIVLISASVGFFLFPTLFPAMQMRWIFQLSGVACLVAVIYIASRYIGRGFIYAVMEDEDGLDLTVTEVTNGGRTRVTVCRFSLSDIESAVLVGRNKEKRKMLEAKAKKEGRSRFNYCAELNDAKACYVFVKEGTSPLLVKLSPDTVLYEFLVGARIK